MSITPTSKIWMSGEFVDWDDARIHVLNPTLHYGWGVFEGIRAYSTARGSAVFRLTDHVARLYRSAKIYMMEPELSQAELIDAIKETVAINEIDACYIRPLIYLGYGEMGLNPLPSSIEVMIAVWPWGAYLGDDSGEKGVRATVSTWRRNDNNIIPPAAKASGQYLNSSLAKVAALKAGYDEAILTSPNGHIADGSGENVFIVSDGMVITPPLSDGPLGGITRASIMQIASDQGYQVREQHIVRTDLYLADEAFFTGTAAEMVPIVEIDDRPVGSGRPGPITRELLDLFHQATRGELDRYKIWNEPVREA
ncbi:branched-chain-amino-acid transaminase [Frankia sp. CiP3]|uniref:branched-chain-amino-acid transaminase n=1 Tax=Frankia sp. CiP3 TaxID=2880971 RepID=UPI001EF5E84E|nr:branched-chain-amino-acid transaminase [Frankia sp. CiP3]